MGNAYEFDRVAQEIFFPIYPVIAAEMLERTGIRSGRMLDVGCGGGHLGLSILKTVPDLRGILLDINPDAVGIADRRAADWGLRDRVVAVTGNVEQLPLPDESIDLIVSRGSLPFWEHLPMAFSELLRVLAPDGMAYLGGGLGRDPALAAAVEQQMKAYDPAWPSNIRQKSRGRTAGDYRAVLRELNAVFEVEEEDSRCTILLHKA